MSEVAFIVVLLVILFGSGLAALIIALSSLDKISSLKTEINALGSRIDTLQSRFSRESFATQETNTPTPPIPGIVAPAGPLEGASRGVPSAATPTPHTLAAPPDKIPDSPSIIPPVIDTATAGNADRHPPKTTDTTSWSDTLGKNFARYWTGILGALALVTGLVFLGILTALRFGALPRVLMITLAACTLLFTAFLLRRGIKNHLQGPVWKDNLAAWLRAAGGALILFSAIASSSVPGLQWVQSELHGYLLLFVAIAVNVWLSVRSRWQAQLSFHSIICLVALAIAPPSGISLAAALAASFITTIPATRRGWNWHLIMAEAAFFTFTFIWRTGPLPEFPPLIEGSPLRIEGLLALGALVLAILPILFIAWLPGTRLGGRNAIIARALAWSILAAGIFSYSTESKLFAPLFLLFALCAWVTPILFVRFKRPEWLRVLDTLSALALGLGASFSLIRFEPDMLVVLTVAFFFVAALSLDRRNSTLVIKVCDFVMAGLVSFSALYFLYTAITNSNLIQPQALLHFSALWSPSIFHSLTAIILAATLWLSKKNSIRSITGMALIAILAISRLFPSGGMLVHSSQRLVLTAPHSSILFMGLLILLVLVPKLRCHFTFIYHACLALCAASIIALFPLLFTDEESFTLPLRLLWAFGLALPSIAPFILARVEKKAIPVWALPSATLAGALILPVLIFSPTIAWSAIALSIYTALILIMSRKLDNERNQNALRVSAFVIQLIVCTLLVPQSDMLRYNDALSIHEFNPLWYKAGNIAIMVALFSLASQIIYHKNAVSRTRVLRTSLGFIILFLFSYFDFTQPFLRYSILSLVLLALSRLWRAVLTRPLFHRYDQHPAIVHSKTIALDLASHSYWSWIAALASFFFFLVFTDSLSNAYFIMAAICVLAYTILALLPESFGKEGVWASRFDTWPSRFFVWPLFCITLLGTLAGEFTGLLSILLFIQSLIIFTLGIIYRDRLSRPVSWSILILGFLHLFFVDLARADSLGRAMVFIIAGLSLLAMNFIYNRFAVEKKEED